VKATASALIVAVTISSWIAISNHCALSAFAAKANNPTSSCPFHSKPAKPQPKSSATECCKILRAIPSTPAKNVAPAILDLLPVNNASHQLATLEPAKISLTPLTLDTGPPGKTSFIELNRSLRAHAPPFLI
jgi:hypothetical protein